MNKLISITDGKSISKFILFEEFSSKVKVGGSYMIRNYELRGQSPPLSLLVTKRTLFFRASTLSVEEELLEAARDLLHPKSQVTPLNACHNSHSLLTVKGEVVEVGFAFLFFFWFFFNLNLFVMLHNTKLSKAAVL